MLLSLILACSKPHVEPPEPTPEPTDTVDTVDTDVTTGPGPTDTGDTDPVTTPTVPAYDCSVLPAVPVAYDTMQDWGTAEDFDFDTDGYHVSVINSNLIGYDLYDQRKIISPDVGSVTNGTRVSVTGDWIVADSGRGDLVKVDVLTGGQTVLAGGLSFPNGVEVSRDGTVFVAENGIGRVIQVDPVTKERWVVATGLDGSNGLAFNQDESILYVGSFGSGKVWGVPRVGPTEWGPSFVLWDTQAGADGGFDGINTDICGNVYITEYVQGRIWRITPDGLQGDLVVDLPSSWIPNLRWGTGVGGWETDVLYVADRTDGRLFALHMGIEGRTHVSVPVP